MLCDDVMTLDDDVIMLYDDLMTWYESRDINHTIYFNEDVKKILLKLSKDIFQFMPH